MNAYQISELGELVSTALLIIGLVAVIVTPWLIRARERARVHDTLSKAAERGVVLPPELLRALTESSRPKMPARPQAQRDLRTGVIWLSVAVGLGLLAVGLVLGHDPNHLHLPIRNPYAALGVAALPGSIGIGYIVLWWAERREAP